MGMAGRGGRGLFDGLVREGWGGGREEVVVGEGRCA